MTVWQRNYTFYSYLNKWFLTNAFCLGEATKFGRGDSSSPAPPTSLSTAGVQSQAQQAVQAGTPGQGQGQNQGQQAQNQAFLNPPLPPGYGYTGKDWKNYVSLVSKWTVYLALMVCVCVRHFPITKCLLYIVVHKPFFLNLIWCIFVNPTWHLTGLPYYAGMPGVPSAFQYGPTVFVPPASAKQPAMGLANPSNQYHQQHQPNYGQHAYGAGITGQMVVCDHAGGFFGQFFCQFQNLVFTVQYYWHTWYPSTYVITCAAPFQAKYYLWRGFCCSKKQTTVFAVWSRATVW